jgi:hypothetical protein
MDEDWVEVILAGGDLLYHTVCKKHAVRVNISFSNSWGMPNLFCTQCRYTIPRWEVPAYSWSTHGQELQRLPETRPFYG